MHFYQTKSIHPTRSWTLDFAVLARLPVLLILWSACWLLTGCDVPGSSLTPGPKPENELTNQAYSLTVEELSEAFSEETFREFFTERQAEAIWNRLRLCLAGTISGGIAETIIDQDTTMNAMLLQHLPEKQAELRKAITLYIGYQKQLYLLSAPRITQEIAFDNLLLSNGLGAIWDRLQSAKNNLQDAVDLSGMLQGLPPIVQIHVLEKLIPWINKHLHVIALDLSGNSLTMLPESMGDLRSLLQLTLSYNNLTELPACIGNLTKLRDLNLSLNNLTELPACIGNLKKLRDLNVSRNDLTELPACIGNLPNLRNLNVSRNDLTLLPEFIGNLSKLRTLNVSGNNLTELPNSMENLSSLRQLDLFYNHLTELPACIGNLSKLRCLDVSHNDLTVLPDCIGNLPNLYALYIGDNQLTVLPGSLQRLSMLNEFSACYNLLVKPAACQDMGVQLTASNVHEFCFPSLKELAALCIVQEKLYYNTPAHTTLPADCISHIQHLKTYPVMLFTTQLGRVTLSQPVPIITKLSYKQIRDYLSSESQVILIQQT